jgi:hypothetical protein
VINDCSSNQEKTFANSRLKNNLFERSKKKKLKLNRRFQLDLVQLKNKVMWFGTNTWDVEPTGIS